MLFRGPILNPQPNGTVDYYPDGVLVADAGKIVWVGAMNDLPAAFAGLPVWRSEGVLLPPFLDLHTHFPQHPIRGCFTHNIEGDPDEGRLLAGLRRNVFPVEARCADGEYTERLVAAFARDTLSHGVVGGAAYGTVHAAAAGAALRLLPDLWSVGLVLMNANCPEYLRTQEEALGRDIAILAQAHGTRLIVTDRFAVSVTTPLRKQAAAHARAHGLRMQTHLNEQRAEKALVEQVLYPEYESYTDVYRRDGLLERQPIVAHCIQMTPPEWRMLTDAGAAIAHCPTSNTLLGSGVMPLDDLPAATPYAICTDVGASPTCSMLCEMAQFLKVHAGASGRATPEEALYRATLAPAQILGVADRIGTFAPGMPLSFIDVALPVETALPPPRTASEAILTLLGRTAACGREPEVTQAMERLRRDGLPHGKPLTHLTEDVHQTARRLNDSVLRVVLDGRPRWQRRPDPRLSSKQ